MTHSFDPSREGAAPSYFSPSSLLAFASRRRGEEALLGRFGAFEVRLAAARKEVRRAQKLRYRVFFEEGGAKPDAASRLARRDLCAFDRVCEHLLVYDMEALNRFGRRKPRVVGAYRLLTQEAAARNFGFYSAREFDLAPLLARRPQTRFLELGRACVDARYRSKRVVELLWRGLWIYAQRERVDALIGCASLAGADPEALALPLSFLHHHAGAGAEWGVRPPEGRRIEMNLMPAQAVDARRALAAMPPLLKAYLRVGAKFGDGAVLDPQFGTIDVFTVMPVAEVAARYAAYFGAPMERPDGALA
ncbi:GNAT family N-acetyltransferase [Methylocella sp.]|uniref:GNAT family N-acetyltransferase n=1 Tax=Methylocella sp. TaxID=1978226 RepID=UPI00378486D1